MIVCVSGYPAPFAMHWPGARQPVRTGHFALTQHHFMATSRFTFFMNFSAFHKEFGHMVGQNTLSFLDIPSIESHAFVHNGSFFRTISHNYDPLSTCHILSTALVRL
jgi:hypothetical protein